MKVFSHACMAMLCLLILQTEMPAQSSMSELPAGKWWRNQEVVQQLQLTGDQQERIEKLWREHRRSLIDQKAALDRLQLDLSELMSRQSVEEATALKAFDQVRAARLVIDRETFLMRIRIKNMLLADQQQKLEELARRYRRARVERRAPGSPLARP